MPNHFIVHPVYFYDSPEPNTDSINQLTEFVNALGFLSLQTIKVDSPLNQNQIIRSYLKVAESLECRRIVLDDTMDYLDAAILCNMCINADFSGPSVHQTVKHSTDPQKVISIIRPFCYITDKDIETFGSKMEFPNTPTGAHAPENSAMSICRSAMADFGEYQGSNARRKIFDSQFAVQRKYVGDGIQDDLDA